MQQGVKRYSCLKYNRIRVLYMCMYAYSQKILIRTGVLVRKKYFITTSRCPHLTSYTPPPPLACSPMLTSSAPIFCFPA